MSGNRLKTSLEDDSEDLLKFVAVDLEVVSGDLRKQSLQLASLLGVWVFLWRSDFRLRRNNRRLAVMLGECILAEIIVKVSHTIFEHRYMNIFSVNKNKGENKIFKTRITFFSVNTRNKKSPVWLGSNVEGTMQYVPGGSLNRVVTSRELMNVCERAAEGVILKKFRPKGFSTLSGLCT